MLMYENFIDKITEKFPRYKLAKALVSFINDINPELECHYKKGLSGDVWVKTKDDVSLLVIEKTKRENRGEFGGASKVTPITLFHGLWEFNNTIKEFLLYFFGANIISFKIKTDSIDNNAKYLTKQNYEDFKLKQNVNKYNL